jgi:hypothetical protein
MAILPSPGGRELKIIYMVKSYFIYAYPHTDKRHVYYELPSLDLNCKDNSIAGLNLQKWTIEKQIVKTVGAIFEVETEDQAVHYSRRPPIRAIWQNEADKLEWSVKRAAFDNVKELKAEASTNLLRLQLEPIKELYQSHTDYKTKRFILAEIIRIITS